MQVRLFPTPAQEAALADTLLLCNEAAGLVSGIAWETKTFRNYDLRRHTYGRLKAMGLSAQPAQHVIKKVADAYTTVKAQARAKLRKPLTEPIAFRTDAAQPFDDRCLSWQVEERTVSIWTTGGRMKGVRFGCSDDQARALAAYRRGESDLIHRDGLWLLIATCDVPDGDVTEPDAFLGVDLGIANIATTSDGERHTGVHLNAVRRRNRRLRRRLQAKRTTSAKRLLKKRRRKESRFARDVNHVISKSIVTEAARTGRGIALEDLQGIRDRVRLRKPQRITLHSWAFHQLGAFIAYKARRSGVVVTHVDPAYTSQGCSACGHTDRRNRPDQETFSCTSCGFAEHADVNAARNIAARGEAGRAAVNQPNAA
ncbi:RNA-guided endonuclease TnpB family protein [Streptosporangium nondiastaticum]